MGILETPDQPWTSPSTEGALVSAALQGLVTWKSSLEGRMRGRGAQHNQPPPKPPVGPDGQDHPLKVCPFSQPFAQGTSSPWKKCAPLSPPLF